MAAWHSVHIIITMHSLSCLPQLGWLNEWGDSCAAHLPVPLRRVWEPKFRSVPNSLQLVGSKRVEKRWALSGLRPQLFETYLDHPFRGFPVHGRKPKRMDLVNWTPISRCPHGIYQMLAKETKLREAPPV